ncbi:HeH/LEM domain-containing protein [Stutzerimonas stutzeri]|uniref:HeH/LEM domain-containing protein n=1 Tax=Stutzerimonas stutzeri TaxID=316 RepID=UPI0005EBA5EA|nr:HeH/LEM domain-containing protein [Stutzerimonas stutzeri]
MSEQKIKYEPHPVTPERKAELRAQGFKIIDARFAPPGEVVEQVDTDTNGDGKLSVAEIRAALTAKGVEFDPKAKKAELQALLDQSEAE